MTEPDRHCITGSAIAVEILAQGAELCSLRDAAGRELLWQAEPAWPRHAPVLFPIVGRLRNDTLLHDGQDYRLTQHGFARDRRFAWAERAVDRCTLLLKDDAATRALYPFAFRFALEFAVAENQLTITYVIHNPGDAVLPVSAGAHPAFRWPILPGLAREAHHITFAQPEPAPIRRLQNGLLKSAPEPTPIEGTVLKLRDNLFIADAIILDRPASQSLRYTAPGAPCIDIAWTGFAELGIWTRAPGDFLCIEPWKGFADSVDAEGDFSRKPGLMHISPGETRRLEMRIALTG